MTSSLLFRDYRTLASSVIFLAAICAWPRIGSAQDSDQQSFNRSDQTQLDQSPPNQTQSDQDIRDNQRGKDKQRDGDHSESAAFDDDNTPMLGVQLMASPGDGVLIGSTVWGSPADEAGLHAGDFIMAIDGNTVSTPADVKEAITRLDTDSNATAKLKIWRNEETFTKEIQLARLADTVPDSHRAWLGVVLTPSHERTGDGVEVSYVFPNSPADNADLRQGDVILKAGDDEASDIESLLRCIEKHGPGAGCVFSVRRNNEVKKVPINLGDLDQAPLDWLISAFHEPIDVFEWQPSESKSEFPDGNVTELIGELRREVAELRAKVESLQPNQREREERDTSQLREYDSRDNQGVRYAAQLSALSSPATALMAQVTVSPTRNRSYYRRQFGRPYNNRYRYGYGNSRYGRYPNSGWYYNYNGNRWYSPRYSRGGVFYGPRFGIRVGPGWGAYWY